MTLVIVIIAVLAAQFVVGPILIKLIQRIPARPVLELTDRQERPSGQVPVFFGTVEQSLGPLGFASVADLTTRMGPAVAFLRLFANRGTNQLAIAAAMCARVGTEWNVRDKHVQLSTRYIDDVEILTTNTSQVGSFKRVPQQDSVSFREVADLALLCALHRARVQRAARSTPVKPIPMPGQEIGAVEVQMANDVARQVGTGYLYLDAGGQVYRPTWKGAALMTWKVCWPVKPLLRWKRDRRAKQLRRSLGL